MNPQFIYDTSGRAIGVFLTIENWDKLKNRYNDISNDELPQWQQELLDKRIELLDKNPNGITPLDEFLKELE